MHFRPVDLLKSMEVRNKACKQLTMRTKAYIQYMGRVRPDVLTILWTVLITCWVDKVLLHPFFVVLAASEEKTMTSKWLVSAMKTWNSSNLAQKLSSL